MKPTTLLIVLLSIGFYNNCLAQSNKKFEAFARTKDSLMHIAFYDKDIAGYKKNFDELKVRYNKLSVKDKEQYQEYGDNAYYNLACAYARIGDKDNAIESLERSKYYEYEWLQKDADMDNLRQDPRFIAYLNTAKKNRSAYMTTLQKDAVYNEEERTTFPSFTYQDANDPNLTALKKAFNLDSIAGHGNDVSRIINLMQWVHYLVPHNGAQGNPEVKNAMSLIKECRQEHKTLNCRGLAILLNEVYLAEGFKSRFVTCLPKDPMDQDCHVITMVWSTSLKKWLWMDPTFMAYIMDEQGTLLSIEQVRERLVNDMPLILNPDANHNHETPQTKSDYLENYMAKNLYKLECPLNSTYNYETYEEGKTRTYVQLLPGNTPPKTVTKQNKHGIVSYTRYYTNNPKTFWTAPPGSDNIKPNSNHTLAEYEAAMAQFKNCYNQGQVSCVQHLVIDDFKQFWNDPKRLSDLVNRYGKMKSYTFIGMEEDNKYEDVALFMVVHDKSTHCMAISLDGQNKIATFRFYTTSSYIDWALAKAIDRERGKQ